MAWWLAILAWTIWTPSISQGIIGSLYYVLSVHRIIPPSTQKRPLTGINPDDLANLFARNDFSPEDQRNSNALFALFAQWLSCSLYRV